MTKNPFLLAKETFNTTYKNQETLTPFLPYMQNHPPIPIKTNNQPNQSYYLWQLIYALTHSNLFPITHIAINITIENTTLEAAIFNTPSWQTTLNDYLTSKNPTTIQSSIIAIISTTSTPTEPIETHWKLTLKPKLEQLTSPLTLGILYDFETLYLFCKYKNKYLKYKDLFNPNQKTPLTLPDPYTLIPSLETIQTYTHQPTTITTNEQPISNLTPIQINNILKSIYKTTTTLQLQTDTSIDLITQIIAMKIISEYHPQLLPTEKKQSISTTTPPETLTETLQPLLNHTKTLHPKLFTTNPLNLLNPTHLTLLTTTLQTLQPYSLTTSDKTYIYQYFFHFFTQTFKKNQLAQFMTPPPLTNFITTITNPKPHETILDPTVGLGDFLTSACTLNNIPANQTYGIDIDPQIIKLAYLNIILHNPNQTPNLETAPSHGSLLYKFNTHNTLSPLIPELNQNGNWHHRNDNQTLKTFNTILTNPPFGKLTAFQPKNTNDQNLLSCYTLWNLHKLKSKKSPPPPIDLGCLFLENAYHLLDTNGKLGIIISNSIASLPSHTTTRQWLFNHMRIVATLDFPRGVFADTATNTTIIIAYKPNPQTLQTLINNNYQIFMKSITNIGYQTKTVKSIKHYIPNYAINPTTKKILTNQNSEPITTETFTETIHQLTSWLQTQEPTLISTFLN